MPQRKQPIPSVVDSRARPEAERFTAPVESVPIQPAPSVRDQTTGRGVPQSTPPRRELDAVQERKEKATAGTAEGLEERVTVSPEARQALARAAAPDIVSPGGAARWRIVGGQIQGSTDQGQTWQSLTLPAGTTITTGHSPAPSVAWFVGRAGAIFVTTDGTRLEPVPFVSRIDLASVTAIDDRQATVTTVDGRVFRTTDRGNRWESP